MLPFVFATLFVIAMLLTLPALCGLRIVQEYERCVVFRFGKFHTQRGPGLFWLIPMAESMRRIDMRTATVDVPPQDVITGDSVSVSVDAVIYYHVVDPVKSVLSVRDAAYAMHLAALTTLRTVIGQHELDDLLGGREAINHALREILGEMSGPWGLQLEAVEIKAVNIPDNMQRAMAKQAEAMREKRARLIKAESELEASEKLAEASRRIQENPIALELRRLQTIAEVGTEQNTTTIILLPSDFVLAARGVADTLAAGVKAAALAPPAATVGNGAAVAR